MILFSVILWCAVPGPMTHACWLQWVKPMKNCHSKWKQRRCACYSRKECGSCNKMFRFRSWHRFHLFSVTGGRTQSEMWRKWLCSNWQSKWITEQLFYNPLSCSSSIPALPTAEFLYQMCSSNQKLYEQGRLVTKQDANMRYAMFSLP